MFIKHPSENLRITKVEIAFKVMRSLWEEHRRKRSQGCALRNPVRDEERESQRSRQVRKKEKCVVTPGLNYKTVSRIQSDDLLNMLLIDVINNSGCYYRKGTSV